MKEATGELNMTVIVVIALAAISALFVTFIMPMIQNSITTNSCHSSGYNTKDVNGKLECDYSSTYTAPSN
ncbi:MAG: hypothetical protein IJ574_05795 [Bacilli bacterium]|nr:hypothetical protein [Bacilli bacterium]